MLIFKLEDTSVRNGCASQFWISCVHTHTHTLAGVQNTLGKSEVKIPIQTSAVVNRRVNVF